MDAEAPSEELEEVEAELSKSDKKKDRDMETGVARKQQEVCVRVYGGSRVAGKYQEV